MPIYEYRCEACGHEFEKLQKMSDPVITDCPVCHQAKVKKLVSAAGFRLKGGGWYETDFKQSGKRNLAGDGADKTASKDSSGSSATKTDATAKTKSDSKTSTTPAAGATKDKVA